ncbi:hypothetical protein ACFVXE_17205 [Streptomyces sp. NPDC058231]|uniref:hypothetical protein n=1 Tax=Streptomyces sp. NPDC058231 TaxID=3346392 RepID=UPI0036F0E6E6
MGALGAVASGAMGELVTELSSFTKFRDRIDELLRNLKASPAGPGKVAEDTVGREKFGGGAGAWGEADALHGAYSRVIKELEQLSQLLSDSIEGMNIAVLASHKGYEHVDLDVRQRMLAIKSSTEAHHKAEQAVANRREEQAAASEKPMDPPKRAHGAGGY